MQSIQYAILFVFVLSGVAGAEPPVDVRTVSIDMLLQRERVGAVFVDKRHNRAYIEKLRPAASLTGPLPFRIHTAHYNARKIILSVPLDGSKMAEPLFEQSDDKAYWFASAYPMSPDGRYWAVVRMDDGRMNPGVYDSKRSRVRFFDIRLEDGVQIPVIHWASDHELILLTEGADAERKSTFSPVVQGARDHAEARQRAWRNREVTSSVIGSGKYANVLPPLEQSSRIVRLNIRTGEVALLAEGVFWRIEVSPGGKYIAVTEVERSASAASVIYDKSDNSRSEFGAKKEGISVFNAKTGQKQVILPEISERLNHLSWAERSQELLFSRQNRAPGSKRETRYFVFDASSGAITRELPEDADSPYWLDEFIIYQTKSGSEDGGSETSNWMTLAYDGKKALLAGNPGFKSIELVAASGDRVYFLSDGDLWTATPSVRAEKLTAAFPEPLSSENALINLWRLANDKTDSFGRAKLGRLGEPSDVFLSFNCDGKNYFANIGEDGRSISVLSSLKKAAIPVMGSPGGGAVFLSNTKEHGSILSYIDPGNANETIPLLQFNQHFIGVESSTESVRIDHAGPNGEALTSWLYLPPGADPSNPVPYPLVVTPYAGFVYGGELQHGRGGYTGRSIWDVLPSSPITLEILTGKGYAVLTPSVPLGPEGQPDEPMARIASPVLSAVDAAIATGRVDPDRLAAIGHSYGGFSVLSIAVNTDRFNALIGSASTSNLTDRYGGFREYMKHDAGSYSFRELTSAWMFEDGQHRMAAAPWEDIDRYVRNSPLFYADKVETPLMLIHGDLDFVDIDQSEQMFTALARQNKDVLFVRYWGEEHTITQPQNQRDLWRRVFDFLEENGVPAGVSKPN